MFQTFPAILGWDLKSLVINYRWYTNQTFWNIWTHISHHLINNRNIYPMGLMEPQPGSGFGLGDNSRILGVVVLWPWSVCHLQLLGMAAYREWVTIEVRMDTNLVSFDHFGWCLPSTILGIILTDTQILSYSVSFLANQTSLAAQETFGLDGTTQLVEIATWERVADRQSSDQFTPFHPAIMIVCLDFWANEYQT
jgi:hypothetical protein